MSFGYKLNHLFWDNDVSARPFFEFLTLENLNMVEFTGIRIRRHSTYRSSKYSSEIPQSLLYPFMTR